MSYLERLESIRDNLISSQSQFQNIQDNIQLAGEQLLKSKLDDIGAKMEEIGGLGLATVKAGDAVKGFLNKLKGGKKDETDEAGEEETEETEPYENPDGVENTDTAETVEPEGEDFTSFATPAEDIGDVTESMELTTFSQEELPETVTELMPEGGGEVIGEVSTDIARNTTTMSVDEIAQLTGQGETVEGITGAINDAGDLTAEATSELLTGVEDTTNAVVDGVTSLATDIGTTATEAVSTATDALATAGEVAEGVGLAVGEAVLDAIPIVGEVAMVGTLIGGFFEKIFQPHHNPLKNIAPEAITSSVGFDKSALINDANNGVSTAV
jgi:hypothetical protein